MSINLNNGIPEADLPVKNPSGAALVRYVENGKSYSSAMPDVVAASALVQGSIDSIIADANEQVNAALTGIGYLPPVDYASGLLVDSSRFTVEYDGDVYAAMASAVPFTTGASFDPSKWRVIQGVTTTDLGQPTGSSFVGFSQGATGAVVRNLSDRGRDSIRANDFSNTMLAIDLADAVRGEVEVPHGVFDIDAYRGYGVTRFSGPGQVLLKPSSASSTWRLANSYADRLTYDLGKEYLYAFHATIYAYNRPKIFLYGDSTVNGFGTTAPFRPQDVLDATFFAQGLASFEIANFAVDGQASNEWDPAAAIADANCRLLIVSYGINDGAWGDKGDDFELFYNNMSSRLATIRASRGVDTLSICIKASNSTNDWFNGRDQVWHERLNNVYRRLAREYKCYFFDTYALWNDSQDASTWMDTINYGGQDAHIHPTNLGNMWIWGKLGECLVPKSINQRLFNGFKNVRDDYSQLPESTPPADIGYGISMYRATLSSGWPLDGAVITSKQADGVTTQRLIRFGNALPLTMVRHAVSPSSWSSFSSLKVALSLVNGWSNYDDSQFATASFYTTEDGEVCIQGLIKNAAALDDSVIFTLPEYVRPARNRVFELSCASGRLQAVILPNGECKPLVYSGTPSYVSLESIRFKP